MALSLLDSIQPVGLSRLVVDWAAVWPVLSVLAEVEPLAAVQVLERDAFRDLGTVIAPRGEDAPGALALRVVLRRDSGELTELEVAAGSIVRLPLAFGEEATLEVRPTRSFDIGLGRWESAGEPGCAAEAWASSSTPVGDPGAPHRRARAAPLYGGLVEEPRRRCGPNGLNSA